MCIGLQPRSACNLLKRSSIRAKAPKRPILLSSDTLCDLGPLRETNENTFEVSNASANCRAIESFPLWVIAFRNLNLVVVRMKLNLES